MAFFLGYTEAKNYTQNVSPGGEVAAWVSLAQVERTLSYENLRTYFKTHVRPLFSRKRSTNQVRADVIFSETEPCKNGAELLTRALLDSDIPSDCVELNQLAPKKGNRPTHHISYFLSNHQNVPGAAFWCERSECYVVNGEYLRFWHSKAQVQRLLKDYGVPTFSSDPHLLANKKDISAWMIKSEKHGVKNRQLLETSRQSSPWDTYLEQRADEKHYTEVKLGYVSGQILTDNGSFCVSPKLRRSLHRIQERIGLEVFSADIFWDKTDSFYIVDVNPAPAFFNNKKARHAFAAYIRLIERFHLK